MARVCTQCGGSIPDNIGFCGQCGAPAPVEAAPQHAAGPPRQKPLGTMIGIPAVGLSQPPSPSPPMAPPQPSLVQTQQMPPHASQAPRNMGTMIGMPATGLSAPPAQPSNPPQAAQNPAFGGDKATLLGVAIPGIAPTRSNAPTAPSAPPNPGRGVEGTLLGVAIPGVAPTHSSNPPAAAPYASARPRPMAALPPIVPAPAPLELGPLPAALQRNEKKGFPLAVVAGVVGAAVVIAGIATAVLWKGAPPVLVQPRLGPQGDDELHLTCESCPDGTVVSVGGGKAAFAKTIADVTLTTPLHTGENPLDLALDRPGVGRDEIVHAVVPISFRIKADISTLDSDAPAITVRVEAAPGSQVNVDGTNVPLDAQGKGAHVVDVLADLSGAADEGKQLEKKIPYDVTMKDAASRLQTEHGTVIASAPIPPLRVDAPTAHAVIDKDSFFLAGRTIPKGATVTAGGRALPVGENGFFGDTFNTAGANARSGDTKIVVRASAANMAPRIIELDVKRVDSLPNEAKVFEARSPLGYDLIAANPDANKGKEVWLAGETLDARVQNHQTVVVMSDARSCAHPPCVARVIYGAELALHARDPIRVYGTVTGAAADKDGKKVPEIEANFILRGLK
ncbi:MAG: hypothetical protein ABI461_04785 [Polyangiaceae bacterium]